MKAAFFILTCCLALTACKEEKPVTTPVEEVSFTWQGKPIDPICFSEHGDTLDTGVDLAACTGRAGKDAYTVPVNGLETFEDGAIGYNFECPDGCMRPPFVAYKHLGMVNGSHAVLVETSGGGTGYFSGVALYDVVGNKLVRKQSFTGGDRCNGGIEDASVTDGAVRISSNITAFDLVEIAGGNQAGFAAYDELQACAVCCVGTANYVGEQLESVSLTLDPKDIINENLGAVDACFFGTYNETYMAGETTLSGDALKGFGATFNQRCAQLKGKALPISTVPTN